MQIAHLQTFVQIIEAGSISQAAKILHYSQSSVTAHVQILERTFNVRLLDRTPMGITPTVAGDRLYCYARAVLVLLSDARNSFAGEESRVVARLGKEVIGRSDDPMAIENADGLERGAALYWPSPPLE